MSDELYQKSVDSQAIGPNVGGWVRGGLAQQSVREVNLPQVAQGAERNHLAAVSLRNLLLYLSEALSGNAGVDGQRTKEDVPLPAAPLERICALNDQTSEALLGSTTLIQQIRAKLLGDQ